ncbi:MAG: hypothetical protein ACI9EH_000125 [Planktomarina sp.]|jgi:hypothetical protein
MHFTRMRHSTFCATSNIQAKKPIDCQANWPGHSVSIESNHPKSQKMDAL